MSTTRAGRGAVAETQTVRQERDAERGAPEQGGSQHRNNGRFAPPKPPPPPPPPPRQDTPPPSESDGGDGDDDDYDRARGEAYEEELRDQSSFVLLWRLKGKVAGRAAADAARAQRPYSADVPPDVSAAGTAAELAYLLAFEENFKTPAVQAGELVSGLVLKKKRPRSSVENLSGLAGLKASADPHLSATVYALVRNDFFSPADHARAVVHAGLVQHGFHFTDAEFEEWWEEKGHSSALQKARSARHSIVDDIKHAVWLAHGAAGASRSPMRSYRPRTQWVPARRRREPWRVHPPQRRTTKHLKSTTRLRRRAPTLWRCSRAGRARRRTTCRHRGARQQALAAASLANRGGSRCSRLASRTPGSHQSSSCGNLR